MEGLTLVRERIKHYIPLAEDLLASDRKHVRKVVRYIMKRHQYILLLSTMHHNDAKKMMCRCCKPSSTGKHKQATHPTVTNDALLQCVRFRGCDGILYMKPERLEC
ncbi:hypothetical protein T09_13270 [Trichinella sp. T9]|nr:hypothetical protein T09_13270 [Trichinella sp. T9]